MDFFFYITIIVGLAIAGGTITSMLKMILSHREKTGGVSQSAESSLTTSELENMLRRVVKEANEPLKARLDDLEALRENAPLSLPPKGEQIQTDLDEEPAERVLASRPRSRTR